MHPGGLLSTKCLNILIIVVTSPSLIFFSFIGLYLRYTYTKFVLAARSVSNILYYHIEHMALGSGRSGSDQAG